MRAYEAGESRALARGAFFGRAKNLARAIDPERPIALGSGLAMHRIVAQASGRTYDESDEYEAHLATVWRTIIGVEMTDEEWIAAGKEANRWLDELDASLSELAIPEPQLRARGGDASDDDGERMSPEHLAEGYAEWDALDETQKVESIRGYLRRTWLLSEAASDRVDAHVCGVAWRLNESAHSRWKPGENDGADLRLSVHVGENAILLTEDTRLIEIVDACGTYQAPWVRRLTDLDAPLPEGPPWGEYARGFAASWQAPGRNERARRESANKERRALWTRLQGLELNDLGAGLALYREWAEAYGSVPPDIARAFVAKFDDPAQFLAKAHPAGAQ